MPRVLLVASFVALLTACGGSKSDAHAPAAKEEPPCDSAAASKCDAERNVCSRPASFDQPNLRDCEAEYQACMRKAGC
jgi:hypothetical protein